MLAVDGKFYVKENGPQEFEKREINSVQGILKGLLTALSGLGKELTVEHIQAIHKSCMTDVKSRNPCLPGQFRQTNVCMDILLGWISVEGMQDLILNLEPDSCLAPVYYLSDGKNLIPLKDVPVAERTNYKIAARQEDALTLKNTNKQLIESCFSNFLEQKIRLLYQPPVASTIAPSIALITGQYNERIKHAKSEDEKLEIMVETIQKYTRKHPYRDGNNRDFVNCLLIELLINNGLLPTLFFEPNIFEFHTVKQLVLKIKEGQQLFLSIINNPNQLVYGFDNNKIKDIENGKFLKMGQEFLQELNVMIHKMGKDFYIAKDYLLASECFEINYELEKKLTGDQSPEAATTLYNLASSLKELGEQQKLNSNDLTKLHTAKSHFNTAIVLFGKHKNDTSLKKSLDKIAQIEKLMMDTGNLNPQKLLFTAS